MLARGDTAGVFQFEGAGMRDVLRQMRPDRFEDLIAAGALYRPGPMANIPDYCRRKHGEAWEAPHAELREILQETYGIMVYQEQVMQIAQKMAGYSLGGADLLRRAMGKKIRAEMDTHRELFRDGAVARGIPADKAIEVFELMAQFADYGFNKSHAAAYALVSYQTAWMKANHPVAFLAACLSLAREKTDKLAALRQEAGRLGVAVLPPDINRSGADFTVEVAADGTQSIRYALAAVKRVGLAAMQAIEAARGRASVRGSRRLRAAGRRAPAEQDADREPGQGRRLRQPGRQPGAGVRRRRDPAAPGAGCRRRRPRAARADCSARCPRARRCACPTWPTGPVSSGSGWRRTRSAST